MSIVDLSPLDLVLAACLVFASAGLSMALSLGVHRPLLIASIRMVAQMLLVGLALRYVFALSSPWITAMVVIAMLVAASVEVGSRQDRRLAGIWHYGIGGVSVTIATTLVAGLALTGILHDAHWQEAAHLIPLFGIMLGTAMNSTSLSLNAMLNMVVAERTIIETRLALGDTRYQALHQTIRRAVRMGLIPVINQMSGAGIITLPGIMTGQILAGMDPLEAAKSQILLMFLLTGAGAAGVILALYCTIHVLTDERHRLRLDRLRRRS